VSTAQLRPRAGHRDNAGVSEAAATPLPRRGRVWVILILAIGIGLLGYSLVGLSTKKAARDVVRIEGIEKAQETFGGVEQEGDRLGSASAPVSIQVFNDLQCGNCRSNFLEAIPPLVEKRVRPGNVQLLMRHYSIAENPLEKGFFGAEAAAQQGYGWQYTYLFFYNQDEAQRFGIDDKFSESLAATIGELDVPEWREYLDDHGGSGGAIAKKLEGDEEEGTRLGIRTEMATIVTGPGGTRTLQDGPELGQIEAAIAAVE
jgi:protein-disulfide isomerase